MDGKDEEGTDEFLFFSSFFCLTFLSTLHLDSDQNSNSLSDIHLFIYFVISFELASSFHYLACLRGRVCNGGAGPDAERPQIARGKGTK